MKLTAVVGPLAEKQIEENAQWWADNRSEEQADRWLRDITRAIKNLPGQAEQQPLTPENAEFAFKLQEH